MFLSVVLLHFQNYLVIPYVNAVQRFYPLGCRVFNGFHTHLLWTVVLLLHVSSPTSLSAHAFLTWVRVGPLGPDVGWRTGLQKALGITSSRGARRCCQSSLPSPSRHLVGFCFSFYLFQQSCGLLCISPIADEEEHFCVRIYPLVNYQFEFLANFLLGCRLFSKVLRIIYKSSI